MINTIDRFTGALLSSKYSNIKVYYFDKDNNRTSTTIHYTLVDYFFGVVRKQVPDTEDKRVHLSNALQEYVNENKLTSKAQIEGSMLKEIYNC